MLGCLPSGRGSIPLYSANVQGCSIRVIILDFESRDIGSNPVTFAKSFYVLVGKWLSRQTFNLEIAGSIPAKDTKFGSIDNYGDCIGCNPIAPCGSDRFDSFYSHH